jgi:ubiquinone/menaquinone biosynthesis C-methylase UbiE
MHGAMTKIVYDKIGAAYNETRCADPFLAENMLILLKAVKSGKYLDLGCGTGNYTIAFSEKGFDFDGVDPSDTMLDTARTRNRKLKWQSGSAESIPAPDRSYDGITVMLTLHHWNDLDKAFREMRRVLSSHGCIVIFTSTPQQMKGYWMNHYFPVAMEKSIVNMPDISRIDAASRQAGLAITYSEKYFIRADLKDHFLYSGKENPALYFDPRIRSGISTFTLLANKQEVDKGLRQLEIDTRSGKFEEIKNKYRNDAGDYLFIRIEIEEAK